MRRKRQGSPGPFLLEMKLLRERIPDARTYPFNLPAIRNLTELRFHPKVTFFVGENGSGKSTLMEAIAVECGINAEGGSNNFNFSTRESHSNLADAVRLSRAAGLPNVKFFLRAESFFNVATEIERLGVGLSYGDVSLHEQSHGESFFALFTHRFRENSLILMDEPEAALSPKRQIQFLGLLHDFVQNGGQFVIATHSPIIMAYPEATIYLLDQEGIRQVEYTETEHYLVTRGFLANPQRTLSVLFDEKPQA